MPLDVLEELARNASQEAKKSMGVRLATVASSPLPSSPLLPPSPPPSSHAATQGVAWP